MIIEIKMKMIPIISFSINAIGVSYIMISIFISNYIHTGWFNGYHFLYNHLTVAVIEIYLCTINKSHWTNDGVIIYIFMMPRLLFNNHFMCVHHLCFNDVIIVLCIWL